MSLPFSLCGIGKQLFSVVVKCIQRGKPPLAMAQRCKTSVETLLVGIAQIDFGHVSLTVEIVVFASYWFCCKGLLKGKSESSMFRFWFNCRGSFMCVFYQGNGQDGKLVMQNLHVVGVWFGSFFSDTRFFSWPPFAFKLLGKEVKLPSSGRKTLNLWSYLKVFIFGDVESL